MYNAKERTLGTKWAIYLVYRAPADKLTKAAWVVISVDLKFVLSFSNNLFFFQKNFTELA